MHELDLIPEDYRLLCSTRRSIKRFGIICIILLLGVLAGKVVLNKKVADVAGKIAVLEEQQQVVGEQEQQMVTLLQNRAAKERQLQFINMLEQGGGIEQIFVVFDRVMDKSVWFTRWQYQAASLVEESTDQGDQVNGDPMTMKVVGQAIDNTALSDFVDRLVAQPEIKNVKVNNATMISSANSTINFDMDIM